MVIIMTFYKLKISTFRAEILLHKSVAIIIAIILVVFAAVNIGASAQEVTPNVKQVVSQIDGIIKPDSFDETFLSAVFAADNAYNSLSETQKRNMSKNAVIKLDAAVDRAVYKLENDINRLTPLQQINVYNYADTMKEMLRLKSLISQMSVETRNKIENIQVYDTVLNKLNKIQNNSIAVIKVEEEINTLKLDSPIEQVIQAIERYKELGENVSLVSQDSRIKLNEIIDTFKATDNHIGVTNDTPTVEDISGLELFLSNDEIGDASTYLKADFFIDKSYFGIKTSKYTNGNILPGSSQLQLPIEVTITLPQGLAGYEIYQVTEKSANGSIQGKYNISSNLHNITPSIYPNNLYNIKGVHTQPAGKTDEENYQDYLFSSLIDNINISNNKNAVFNAVWIDDIPVRVLQAVKNTDAVVAVKTSNYPSFNLTADTPVLNTNDLNDEYSISKLAQTAKKPSNSLTSSPTISSETSDRFDNSELQNIEESHNNEVESNQQSSINDSQSEPSSTSSVTSEVSLNQSSDSIATISSSPTNSGDNSSKNPNIISTKLPYSGNDGVFIILAVVVAIITALFCVAYIYWLKRNRFAK